MRMISIKRLFRAPHRKSKGFVRLPVTGAIASLVVAPGLLFYDGGRSNRINDIPPVQQEIVAEQVKVPGNMDSILFKKLVSDNRQTRKEAAELIALTQDGVTAKIAKAILVELKRDEKKLEKRTSFFALSHSQPNLELHAIEPKSIESIDIPALISELQECESYKNCGAAEILINQREAARDALIQALLSPDEKTSTFAKMILFRINSGDKNVPLFHDYAKVFSSQQILEDSTDSLAPEKGSDSPNLVGTRWKGSDSEGESVTVQFQEDGVLSYTTQDGTFSNAYWSLNENILVISINEGFAEYHGVVSGSVMSGKAFNRDGKKWSWEFEKQ